MHLRNVLHIFSLISVLSSIVAVNSARQSKKDGDPYVWTGFVLVPKTIPRPDVEVSETNGETAILPCSIDSQAKNITVVWMDELDNVLYYNDNKIIDSRRFTLKTGMGRNWDMMIHDVESSDEGLYRCVANTSPITIKYYKLTVFVPPTILKDSSSVDVEATEGTTVRLQCNATGSPTPTISWSVRRAGEPRNSNTTRKLGEGDVMQVQNVSRYIDEIYTCSARNGFERAEDDDERHHDIRIRVRFKPEVKLSLMKIWQYQGSSVSLTCEGRGYRMPNMYFAKDGTQIQDNKRDLSKYKYMTDNSDDGYKKTMTLNIYDLADDDFGYYKCVALNSMGKSERFVEVIEKRLRQDSTPASNVNTRWRKPAATTKPRATKKPVAVSVKIKEEGRPRRIPDELIAKSMQNSASYFSGHLSIMLLTIMIMLLR